MCRQQPIKKNVYAYDDGDVCKWMGNVSLERKQMRASSTIFSSTVHSDIVLVDHLNTNPVTRLCHTEANKWKKDANKYTCSTHSNNVNRWKRQDIQNKFSKDFFHFASTVFLLLCMCHLSHKSHKAISLYALNLNHSLLFFVCRIFFHFVFAHFLAHLNPYTDFIPLPRKIPWVFFLVLYNDAHFDIYFTWEKGKRCEELANIFQDYL